MGHHDEPGSTEIGTQAVRHTTPFRIQLRRKWLGLLPIAATNRANSISTWTAAKRGRCCLRVLTRHQPCRFAGNNHNAIIIVVMTQRKAVPPLSDDKSHWLSPVDRTDRMPLHEQVAAEVRRAIADGEASAGERIPQAKDLAAVLGVNTNTVLRALRLLREEGLLELGRGRAIVVAGTPERGAVMARMKDLVEYGRRQGYRREELIAMMEILA
jgi:GntR family transcriptional regulator